MGALRRSFLKGGVTGFLQLALQSSLMLVAIPLFIRYRGAEEYGLFALLSLFGTIYAFTGLGVHPALVRVLSAEGKTCRADSSITAAILILSVVSVVVLFIGSLSGDLLLRDLLGVEGSMLGEARVMLTLMLASNAFLLTGQVFTAILDAHQKVHLSNLLLALLQALTWAFIAMAVLLDLSLGSIGWAVFAAAALWFVASMGMALRLWGVPSFDGGWKALRASLNDLITYGLQIYAGNVLGVLFEPATKILVSSFIGVREVGFMDIGFRVRNLLWGFLYRFQYPAYPLLARPASSEWIGRFMFDLEIWTLLLVVPLSAAVILLAEPLAVVWIGVDIEPIALSIAVLATTHLLFSSTLTPYYHYLLARGYASRTVVLQVVNVGVNLIVFLASYRTLAFSAALLSNGCAILASFLIGMAYQRSEFPRQLDGILARTTKPIMVLIGMVALGALVRIPLKDWPVLQLAVFPVLILGLSAMLYRRLGIVRREDVSRLVGEHSRLSDVLQKIFVRA